MGPVSSDFPSSLDFLQPKTQALLFQALLALVSEWPVSKCLELMQMLEAPSGFPGGTMIGGGPDHGSRSTYERRGHVGLPESRKRGDDRALDKEEEDYFNEERYVFVCG